MRDRERKRDRERHSDEEGLDKEMGRKETVRMNARERGRKR